MSASHATGDRLLVPGQTCWRIERADRFAFIVDAADYFRHTKAAMVRAKHRILLIGWDFDSRTVFEPGGKTVPGYNELGPFLRSVVRKRPDLEVYVLRSNLRLLPAFEGFWEGVTPVSFMNRFSSERLHFAIDGAHPTGAVHHQKIVVVDDSVAFCGGIDFTVDRWDTPEHLDENRLRRALGEPHGPRHEVAAAVDGAAARALSEVARDRWLAATGVDLEPVEGTRDLWPGGLEPTLHDVDVAVARTMPRLGEGEEVREVEALNLAGMAAAHDTIYLENQYLASRILVDALCARLREPSGPEVVIVIPRKSESPLEERAMDSARYRMLKRLWAADQHDRLGVYWPVTDGGTPVYVHAKVMAVDDRLFRVGSSNLNNRSLGFDSECDVAIEAHGADDEDDVAGTIVALRNALVCEHLGVAVEDFEREVTERNSFLGAVEALRGSGRTLLPFTPETVAGERSLWAENDLMDPDRVPESFARSVARWLGGFVD
ncbi:phospholipase [Mycobacterium yunnanensis]|uniref:Phospholipase n=1 Tax=Mycobacterium yunnanensis TaxID=368477 RepID=A0A9X3BS83_9MYCO|nr:phospholipase D-like domain-containing protein [Mycobacterium yunnanensis]MCV7420319.1 phospholipase [Mycobacterium yunnanensis]